LLTPVTKAYATDIGVEMANLAIQVFGGIGYIENTGVAQLLRDARIAPIYEGTNGIQALDLVNRKLRVDDGEHLDSLLAEMAAFLTETKGLAETAGLAPLLSNALNRLYETTKAIRANGSAHAACVATPYLRQFALTLGGYLLLRQMVVASNRLSNDADDPFFRAKIETARFFIKDVMAQEIALHAAILADVSQSLFSLTTQQLLD
jgi:hypothetical protein